MIHVKVTNATAIYPAEEIPRATREKVRARLTFENPKWIENEKHGYWNGDTSRELCFLEQENGRLTVPRGFTRQALKILADDGVHFQIEDSRRELDPVDFQFTAELREYQEQAVREMSRRDFGTLNAPTGSGKTVIALALVAERRQPALIVVHSKELLNQWVERIETYSKVLTDLVEDTERNALIVGDVLSEAKRSNGVCLVLSDRRSHCYRLAALLREKGLKTAILTGELSQQERQGIVGDLNAGRVKVLTATGQLIGEGFDCRRLESLFIATPIKFSGRLKQYVGRVLRPAEGKNKARVFDYVDPVGVLEAAARARERVFRRRD